MGKVTMADEGSVTMGKVTLGCEDGGLEELKRWLKAYPYPAVRTRAQPTAWPMDNCRRSIATPPRLRERHGHPPRRCQVLPVQPMLVDREWTTVDSDEEETLSVTFRRKPTDEKGPIDGGLELAIAPGSVGDSGDVMGDVVLTLRTISTGSYVDKSFSQRLLVKSIIRDLPRVPKLSIKSVLHAAMFEG